MTIIGIIAPLVFTAGAATAIGAIVTTIAPRRRQIAQALARRPLPAEPPALRFVVRQPGL